MMKNYVNNWQKIGGISALIMAATFIVGFIVFLGILTPAGYFEESIDPVQKVVIIADNQTIVSISYLIPFVVFGFFLVVLAIALYERLKESDPVMPKVATIFGIIWAGLVMASGMVANVGIDRVVDVYANNPEKAGSMWLAIEAVQLGLGGGNEIVGGLWVLLISWAALRARVFPRSLNYTGVVIGISGLLTVFPILTVLGAVEALGAVFGLGLIVWFVWLGIILLRGKSQDFQGARY